MNPMQVVRIEKVTLNIGAGKDQKVLEKGIKLLKSVTTIDPVQTITTKRIPTWGLRPGLPIGCMITMRKAQAEALLKRLLEAKERKLNHSQFDDKGNLSFGVPEYIDVPGVPYDPEIGVMGFEVCVTLERAGYRLKRRRLMRRRIPAKHQVSRDDAIEFMKHKFDVRVGEAQ